MSRDDRVLCSDCRRYSDMDGRCMAGERYSPVPDVARRCFEFVPHPGAEDQRKGAQRWPELRDAPGGATRRPYPKV